MPLSPSFWVEDHFVPPSFSKMRDMTNNIGSPWEMMKINRGDGLRVSWPRGNDNRLIAVRVMGNNGSSSDKRFIMAVGWPPGVVNSDPLVRWLPLTEELFKLIQSHYASRGADPIERDIHIHKLPNGKWRAQLEPISLLDLLREDEPDKFTAIQKTISLALTLWPGLCAKEWL